MTERLCARRRQRGRPRWFPSVPGFLLLALVVPALATAQAVPDRVLRLESVSILPDDPGTQNLVRRHLTLVPGSPVDVDVLSLARQTLEETGYFREVVLYTARGSSTGQVILYVEVELDRRLRVLTGYGYEPLDGWYLNLIGAKLLNRPRPGSELRLAFRDGFHVGGFYLEGRLPTGERAGDFWRGEAFAESKTWFAYDRREAWHQDIKVATLRIGRELPVGAGGTVTTWGGISGINPGNELSSYFDEDDQHRPVEDLISDTYARHLDLDLSAEGSWQRQDPVRPWRDSVWLGSRLRASYEEGGTIFGTVELDARRKWPVGGTAALAGRLRAAHATGGTPYHQRFQFGGAYSVRGYDFAYLSGPLGAQDLVQGNLELRVPLLDRQAALPRVTGLLFLDTGQCWDDEGGSFGWTLGAGYGIRVRLPWVQYLGLDVGLPVVKLDDISPFVVNIALGWSY
jgi:hypothetical protein